MKLSKPNMQQWIKQIRSALWFLGEHAFGATLALVLGAGVIAGILFWQYVIFSPQLTEEEARSEFTFNKNLFEQLLSDLKQEETRVRNADFLSPRDLFNP